MIHRFLSTILLLSISMTSVAFGEATLFGPSPYLSEADIPEGFYANDTPSALEDFEDGTWDFGITATLLNGVPSGLMLSGGGVDSDAGPIDGFGFGQFFSAQGTASMNFTFSEPLPTAAGMVRVGGVGRFEFEAFGPGMVSLGKLGPFDMGSHPQNTATHRFFGVQNSDGIMAIRFTNFDFATFQIDHIQFGIAEDPNFPPVADATILVDGGNAGGSVELPCVDLPDGHGAVVTLDATASFDPDGDAIEGEWAVAEDSGIQIENPASLLTDATFPVGVHEVTLTVYDLDELGERKGSLDVTSVSVVVYDDTPPLVMVTTDLAALWPANNKMVPVMIVLEASDACSNPESLDVACDITSSQPDDSDGTGELTGDVDGQDGFVEAVPVELISLGNGQYVAIVELRAERDGENPSGRIYSINVTALDAEGNSSTASTTVVVPHDRRKKS